MIIMTIKLPLARKYHCQGDVKIKIVIYKILKVKKCIQIVFFLIMFVGGYVNGHMD